MYARKSLSLAIAAGLMFGIGACSVQEKSDAVAVVADDKDERPLFDQPVDASSTVVLVEKRQERADGRSNEQEVDVAFLQPPPAPPQIGRAHV